MIFHLIFPLSINFILAPTCNPCTVPIVTLSSNTISNLVSNSNTTVVFTATNTADITVGGVNYALAGEN